MMPEYGDVVRICTKEETYEGILMPRPEIFDKGFLVIKLDNGYNIGIDEKKITKIELIKKAEKKKEEKHKLIHKKELPTISILHTGGTIASRVDYRSGGVIASFSAEDMLQMFPEMKEIANIKTELVENMMSEDMRFIHYKKIAHAIKKEIDNGVDGVIIGHGTDTLAITSAALAFMFENLGVPVILVGSQRSSDRGSTDAAMNLICAAEFIARTDFAGVAICMHENISDNICSILPATKTRKMHTSRRDAFKAINDTPIARIDYSTKKIEFLKENYEKKDKHKKTILKDRLEEKVGIIRTHPNMHKEVFEVFRKNDYKGFVLESSGIGQAPTNIKENLPIYEELKKFIKSGGIILLTSQCIFGRVHKDIYTNCRRLSDIGIIFGEDMLTETAFVKLAWLLGNYKKEEVKELIGKNLRGEINDRITSKDFFEESSFLE